MAIKMLHSGTEIQDVIYKPCPFCGGTNLMITEKDNFDSICDKNGSSMLSIRCAICSSETHMYHIPNNNYWMGVGMIIMKWNTRQPEKGDNHGN